MTGQDGKDESVERSTRCQENVQACGAVLVDDHSGDDGCIVKEDALAVSFQLVHQRLLDQLELVANGAPKVTNRQSLHLVVKEFYFISNLNRVLPDDEPVVVLDRVAESASTIVAFALAGRVDVLVEFVKS